MIISENDVVTNTYRGVLGIVGWWLRWPALRSTPVQSRRCLSHVKEMTEGFIRYVSTTRKRVSSPHTPHTSDFVFRLSITCIDDAFFLLTLHMCLNLCALNINQKQEKAVQDPSAFQTWIYYEIHVSIQVCSRPSLWMIRYRAKTGRTWYAQLPWYKNVLENICT